MKLSINQGPKVGKETFNFSISDELTKGLGNFLCDWKASLPKNITKHLEVVTVNPFRLNENDDNPKIIIKIIFEWKYKHYNQDESTLDFIHVKPSFSLALYSSLSGSLENILANKEDALLELKKRLCSFLHSERVTFKEPHNYLEALIKEIEQET